jgi:LacI family transcriptional regulator
MPPVVILDMDTPMEKAVSVTVADVARAANVSKATAARVLGGYGIVSDRVREDVLKAAERLNYRANELARSMTTGRSGIIGVVVGDIENPFFSLAVRGVTDAARAGGFNVILANSGESIDAEKAAVRVLIGKRVDGLIISPSRSTDIQHLVEIQKSGRPLTLLDRALPGFQADTVTVDDRPAAKRAAEALLAAGHRRLAYVTAAEEPGDSFHHVDQIQTSTVRERILGFLEACREAGIAQPEKGVILGASSPEATQSLARRLLSERERPTAVIASDSLIALEIFRVIKEKGLAIPRDLSLITFHNADWTTVTEPPITVIDQPVYDLGRKAAELLVRRLKGTASAPQQVELTTHMIERGSVGPPPAGSAGD